MTAAPALAVEQRIVTLETRPGVTLKVLITTPDEPPVAALIMLPGGQGANHFREQDGAIRSSGNFLLRVNRALAGRGFLTAVMDVPSDRAGGTDDAFRTGPEHLVDVAAVRDHLRGIGEMPHVVIGTSRGTLSAAHIGINMPDLRAVLLTSSIAPVLNLPLDQLAPPLLVVHHVNDTCRITPFQVARDIYDRATATPRKNLFEVEGGDPPRQADPCEALTAHGFLGREESVVGAMTDWLRETLAAPQTP
ncbi:MAG: hypothetical protein U0821_17270 [Chloroflexota bacterium]